MSHLKIANTGDAADAGGVATHDEIPGPAATFRTLRLVVVEVKGSPGVLLELFDWLRENGIEQPTGFAGHPTWESSGYFRGYFLPNEARKIEAWLQENGVERAKVIVNGVEIEP